MPGIAASSLPGIQPAFLIPLPIVCRLWNQCCLESGFVNMCLVDVLSTPGIAACRRPQENDLIAERLDDDVQRHKSPSKSL
jgi:hypothetical protein